MRAGPSRRAQRTGAIARAGIAAMLGGMGVLHLVPPATRAMAAIVPPAVRDRPLSARALVLLTGGCELAGAAGLLLPATRRGAGVALAAYYAFVFPANAYAARHPERFGRFAVPFAPRLAAQAALAGVTLWAAFAPADR